MSELILITLPIGNTKDITLRALEALNHKEIFFAEDTRNFIRLLQVLGIRSDNKKIDSFHDHSKSKVDHIINLLKSGLDVCLVSDAGSPVISDPAYPLIVKAIEHGISINTLPGVTSIITSLELSGLPANPFHFWGFIGRNPNERIKFFTHKLSIHGTHIFFESPHRIYECVEDFFKVFSTGEIVVTRELTKVFQSIIRINDENIDLLKDLVMDKGEFVLLFNIKEDFSAQLIDTEIVKLTNDYLELPSTKKLAKIISKITKKTQNETYSQLVQSTKKGK